MWAKILLQLEHRTHIHVEQCMQLSIILDKYSRFVLWILQVLVLHTRDLSKAHAQDSLRVVQDAHQNLNMQHWRQEHGGVQVHSAFDRPMARGHLRHAHRLVATVVS